jgi:hypothetical protein
MFRMERKIVNVAVEKINKFTLNGKILALLLLMRKGYAASGKWQKIYMY